MESWDEADGEALLSGISLAVQTRGLAIDDLPEEALRLYLAGWLDGTVSFGGSEAAFSSALVMRMSRFSCAITRRAAPSGVPNFSAWVRASAITASLSWKNSAAPT